MCESDESGSFPEQTALKIGPLKRGRQNSWLLAGIDGEVVG